MIILMLESILIWFAGTSLALGLLYCLKFSVVSSKSRLLGVLPLVISVYASSKLLERDPGFLELYCFVINLGVVFMALKLVFGKSELKYIHKSNLRALPWYLISIMAILFVDILLSGWAIRTGLHLPLIKAVEILALSVGVFISTLIALEKYKFKPAIHQTNKADLPTVSLLIPARNETNVLNEALQIVADIDYSKLETLVADDCSQDDTPEIIKEFAHSGIRFVKGAEPHSSWIGKNRAYSLLLEEASGDFVAFQGVDVRPHPTSISLIVDYMLENKLDMVSVLPQKRNLDLLANFLQPLRYFWQLVLPRTKNSTPAVLSSFFIVNRKKLEKIGGFGSFKNAIEPEAFIAREFAKTGRYKFLIADSKLQITTRKRLHSQISTAERTLYPLLHRNIFYVSLVVLFLAVYVVAPFLVLVYSLFNGFTASAILATMGALILLLSHILVSIKITPKAWYLSLINLPVSALLQIIMVLWSAYKYEFSTVLWKGRDVCIPVMKRKKY